VSLRHIGVLYQSGALFGSMSVLENVRLPLDAFTRLPEMAKDLVALAKLKLVELKESAAKVPDELSGGMQKRAALARALVADPAILFLDEPSAGLDPITSAAMDALFKKLSRDSGITLVMVTHELPSIFAIADRVILLDAESKSIVAEGNPHDLRDHATDPLVRHFFRREAI
jgi:phospholipid/cholesterol/gamma-HCH transport system ATP-binding protein